MAKNGSFNYEPYGSIPAGIETVTLSDTVTYEGIKGFISSTDGTLSVVMADGSTGLYPVKGGIMYAGNIKTFKATGSLTITNLVAFY